MRRLLCGLAAAGVLLAPAAQAAQCTSPAEQSAFEVSALKSELMVLAKDCHAESQYNAFVNHYRPSLLASDESVGAYFKRTYGRSGQREYDEYVTSLANTQFSSGLRQGSDFCPRNATLFQEVMALQGPSDLPLYAAGKDLIPADVGTCPEPVRAAPVSKARVVRKHHK
jgi:hypothetical protein